MVASADLPADRLAIGQLLGRLLRAFRQDLFAAAAAARYADLREAHLQVFGNVGIDGIRLTDLASRAQLSLAATNELVNELQRLGDLRREPDPADGRAKLIFPTPRGRQVVDEAGNDKKFLAAVSAHLAEGARRALMVGEAGEPDSPDAPRPGHPHRPAGNAFRHPWCEPVAGRDARR